MGMTPWANRMKSDRPRAERDFYATPQGLADCVTEHILRDFSAHPGPLDVIDPGCGVGVWGNSVRRLRSDCHILGIDTHPCVPATSPSYNIVLDADYLDTSLPLGHADLIIGNPPYRDAEAFIRRSLNLVRPGGYVYFLLQLNFLGSRKRELGLFREFPLYEVHILTRRPSFFSSDAEGYKHTTDASNYAMYLWQREREYKGDTTMKWLYWNYENTLASG